MTRDVAVGGQDTVAVESASDPPSQPATTNDIAPHNAVVTARISNTLVSFVGGPTPCKRRRFASDPLQGAGSL